MSVQQFAPQRKLAMLDLEDGRYLEAERALTMLVDGLREATEPGAGYELGRALLDRATARRLLNRWDDAAADVDACERLAASLPPLAASSLTPNVHSMRAKLHLTAQWRHRDLSIASAELDALEADGSDQWWVREARADLAFTQGDWEEAAAQYADVAVAVGRDGWKRGAAACELRAGAALLELGRAEDAGPLVRRAAEFFAQLGPSDLRASAERHLARLLVFEGSLDPAWEHMTVALTLVETSVRTFRSLFDQQRYLADKAAYYQHAFEVALAAGGAAGDLRAMSVAERAKSFYLCQLLANADVPLFDGVDPADVERLQALEEQLDELEARVPVADGSVRERAELEAHRDAVAQEREQVLALIMRDHPRWASVHAPLPFDAESDLALPAAWCALSVFWHGDDELHFFLARPGEPVVHHAERWSAEELAALSASQEELRGATTGRLFMHPVIPEACAARVMPQEVRSKLREGERVLVSPHGSLRGVPLATECAVQYIPSLALLSLARPRRDASEVLLLGCEQDGFEHPALPGVERELGAVAHVWDGTPIVLGAAGRLGADAPAPAEWDRYRLIHLACHGELDPERPLEGALFLGRSALRMSELFELRLDAELVCLSACDLGRLGEGVGGVQQAGDEWLGFVMPLLYAGAGAILVSLWKAHDTTAARLMPALHEAIHEGRAPADALDEALETVAGEPPGFRRNWYLVGFPQQKGAQ